MTTTNTELAALTKELKAAVGSAIHSGRMLETNPTQATMDWDTRKQAELHAAEADMLSALVERRDHRAQIGASE